MSAIRIGAGNKNVDKVILIFQGFVLLIMLVFAVLFENGVLLLTLFSIGILFECYRILKRNYVTYEDAHFVVRGLFSERARISAGQFDNLSSSIVSIPFSNELIISFKNGQRFKIVGGSSKREDIERLINDLIAGFDKAASDGRPKTV